MAIKIALDRRQKQETEAVGIKQKVTFNKEIGVKIWGQT